MRAWCTLVAYMSRSEAARHWYFPREVSQRGYQLACIEVRLDACLLPACLLPACR